MRYCSVLTYFLHNFLQDTEAISNMTAGKGKHMNISDKWYMLY